jgi:hypothetical protein
MPRAFPSQIAGYLTTTFTRRDADHLKDIDIQQKIGAVAGFLKLYDQLPNELMRLQENDYVALVAAIETVRFSVDQFRTNNMIESLRPVRGIQGALATAWRLIETLRDEVPATTHELVFISDPKFREMVQVDINAVSVDLQSGEWKGATIFAGSCCEALLLYGLQDREARQSGSLSSAVAAIWPNRRQRPDPSDLTDRSWNLFSYSEVAHRVGLIAANTRRELETVRDYRNLIHPAKTVREQATFNRGTAYVSVGALEHVIADLARNLG